MSSTTFEEASRCPKCDNTGEVKQTRPGPNKSQIHILTCQNPPCKWYQTDWVVQQLSDGTIPVREVTERTPKTFPKLYIPQSAREVIDAIKDTELPPDPTSRRS